MTSVKRSFLKFLSPLDSEDSWVPSCPLNLMTLRWTVTLWQSFGQNINSLNVQNALSSGCWKPVLFYIWKDKGSEECSSRSLWQNWGLNTGFWFRSPGLSESSFASERSFSPIAVKYLASTPPLIIFIMSAIQYGLYFVFLLFKCKHHWSSWRTYLG